jgi:hypothetical protein
MLPTPTIQQIAKVRCLRGHDTLLPVTACRRWLTLNAAGNALAPINAAALFRREPGSAAWFRRAEGEGLGEAKIPKR